MRWLRRLFRQRKPRFDVKHEAKRFDIRFCARKTGHRNRGPYQRQMFTIYGPPRFYDVSYCNGCGCIARAQRVWKFS